MKKKYAVIHLDQNGKPYECRVTDGTFLQVIPVTNSSLSTCKKALRQMHKSIDIWISQEAKSE